MNEHNSDVASSSKRSWVIRHKLLTFTTVFLLAALIHYLVTRPLDNPRPQKQLLVQGGFPYDKGWELRIEASYYSKNPTCRQTARAFFIFPQAEMAREVWRSVPVTRESGNHYRFDLYEDAVMPGFCDWGLRFVNYVITENGKTIQGGAMLGFPSQVRNLTYRCRPSTRPRTNEVVTVCLKDDAVTLESDAQTRTVDFIWAEPAK